MRTWTDLTAIEMPPRVAALPRDARGYPIPHAVMYDAAGVPDFRVIDPQKWVRAAQLRRCGVCGETLGSHLAFVGGPLSMANRLFSDLPMHRDCAIYALRTCPFLAAPKFMYARALPDGTKVSANVSPERPERFGLGICRDYHLGRLPDGEIVLRAQPFRQIDWWCKGEQEIEA